MLQKVINIVREASKIMEIRDFSCEQKGNASNWVTSSDIAVEDFLEKELRNIAPDSSFVGEEDNEINTTGKYIWIIDPIDGTSNYMRGLNASVISVSLMYDGKITLGVVYNPYMDEVFYAELGKGAYLNGKSIHVSNRDFAHSHLCSAMSLYDKTLAKPCFNIIEKVYAESDDLRRFGSCALELCQLAAGRVELYFEIRVFAWDCSAACLIIQEAGGYVDLMFNDTINLTSPMGVIAANNIENFEHLKEIVYSEVPEPLYT